MEIRTTVPYHAYGRAQQTQLRDENVPNLEMWTLNAD